MTNENQQNSILIERTVSVFEFPADPIRAPLYSNACLVNLSGNDVFIDFGFADTYPVKPEKKRLDGRGVEILTVAPVARLSINLQVAAALQHQLNDMFNALTEVRQGRGGEDGAQE